MLFIKILQDLFAFPLHRMKNFGIKYGMAIDLDKCIGCYACQVSCKNKNGFLCNEQCIKIYTYEVEVKEFF